MIELALCGALFASATAPGSPDTRARQIVEALGPSERFRLLHGLLALPFQGQGIPPGAIGSAGYVPGIPRLGVPALQETDASLGIANPSGVRPGDVATAMPSGLSLASTWDPEIAYRGGALIGDEAWRKGFNVLLGPGVNVARDPRNGRNFEYLGEDPLLAGSLAGASVCGVQDQHVIATVKHFALNDQETERYAVSAEIGESAMRESDLLAFELALERGQPGAVMCAYNRINGVYACENARLLNGVLKGDWAFPGWVMSDWGAAHTSANAAMNGLDQESAAQLDGLLFDAPLAEAVASGVIPASRISDMNQRILRSMLAVGLVEHVPKKSPIDYPAHAQVALHAAERGIVLLKNDGLLPIASSTRRIAVIGGHADVGVISGGGSAQVTPVGGPALLVPFVTGATFPRYILYDPSSPLAAIRALAPDAQVSYANGSDPNAAAALAQHADIALVFATQWMTEGLDAPDLSLPDAQDTLISAVAQANSRIVVVLETGNPVTMPWLSHVSAVLEAWYPGQRGGEAIANVLFGKSDASGRLPITFPAGDEQLAPLALRLVRYPEGSEVGYRRVVKQGLTPLFAFGHGLSYTSFTYGEPRITGGDTLRASFTVKNTGSRTGTDTPQLYLTRNTRGPEMRLLGWSGVTLAPGETQSVSVSADPRLLADFDAAKHVWTIRGGVYEASLGAASDDLKYHVTARLSARTLKPRALPTSDPSDRR
ncbi:MAG: beta-glucosidase [Candidatus Tumulicola sp.]